MINLCVSIFHYLSKKGYFKFFIVGVSGVFLQLFVTWFFTHFIFGLDEYFFGYLIGLAVTLVFNFISYTRFTFKTENAHGKRFAGFLAHFITMIFIQASLVRYFISLFGVQYYIVVIAVIVFILSNINFLLFKFVIFRKPAISDKRSEEKNDKTNS